MVQLNFGQLIAAVIVGNLFTLFAVRGIKKLREERAAKRYAAVVSISLALTTAAFFVSVYVRSLPW